MSSSGKGQSFIRSADQLSEAWRYAQQGGRAGAGRVIVEGVVNFDLKSPCSPSAPSMACISAPRSVIVRKMAIIVNPGSRSR
jgi:hypothetical protein